MIALVMLPSNCCCGEISAIAIDACCVTWGLACSTRSGVPRISQTYSSYPAGTDILFDATEVCFHHLLSL